MFKEFSEGYADLISAEYKTWLPKIIISDILILTVISFAFSTALLQILSVLLFVSWLTESYQHKKENFNLFCILFSIFLVTRIISSVFSEFPSATWDAFYKELPLYFSVIALTYYIRSISEKGILFLLKLYIISIAISALIAIIQVLVKDLPRAIGIVPSLNTTLLIAFLTMLGLCNHLWTKGQRLLWSAILLIIAICLVLTLTKTHILIALLFTPYLLVRNKIKWYYTVSLIILIIISVSYSFIDNPQLLRQRISDPFNLSSREYLWKGGTELLGKHPLLGFGPKTFKNIFQYKNEIPDKNVGGWHNDFLEVYLESGIISIVILLLIYYSVYSKGIKLLFKNISVLLGRDLLFTSIINITALLLIGLTWGVLFPAILQIFLAFNFAVFGSLLTNHTSQKR